MDATVTFKDGTTHIYKGVPDGTAPDVVEAQASKEFGKAVASLSGAAAATAPVTSLMGRVKNALIAPKEDRDPTFMDSVVNGIKGIPEEVGKEFSSNVESLKSHLAAPNVLDVMDMAFNPQRHLAMAIARPAADAVGAALSPVTGTLSSAIGRPVEQATGLRREVTGNVLSALVPISGEASAASDVAKAQRATAALKPMAMEAHQAGYVLPPTMMSDKPGIIANTLAGWSGKVKTAQAASAKNQGVTNALAAKALNLPEDTTLGSDVFKSIRADAGKAYEAIPQALPHVTADDEYLNTVASLSRPGAEAAQRIFPNTTKNQAIIDLQDELSSVKNFPTKAGVEIVKELRSQATSNLKAFNDPSKAALGAAQRRAADAVDDLIQRNLEQTGNADLVQEYRGARQQIAKSYDVEAATNPATGNVDAKKIAALGIKGKPLTGELDTIAKVAAAFPKAFQSADKFGEVEPLSVLDMGGAALATAHGNPGIGVGMLTRPLARKLILSDIAQSLIARGGANLPKVPQAAKSAPAANALYQLSQQNQ